MIEAFLVLFTWSSFEFYSHDHLISLILITLFINWFNQQIVHYT